jgi:hypothetical protein
MTVPTPGDLAAPRERAAALWLLGFCLLINLLTYGFNLFDVRLSIDNEITGFEDLTPTVWLAKGRWGTHLLSRFVLPHPIIPVVPMAIAMVGFSVAYVLSAMTWRWPIDMAHYAAASFALSFPVLVHVSAFLVWYVVAIGFCLAAVAVWLAARDRAGPLLLAILPLTAAVSVYQPVTLFPIVSFLAFAAIRVPAVGIRRTLRRLVGFSLVVAASLALHYAIWRSWLSFRGLAPVYVDQFLHPDTLWAFPRYTLTTSTRFAWRILSGDSELFLEKGEVFGVTVLLAGGVILADRWITRRNLGQFLLQVLLIGAALLLPLMVVAINGGYLPYRNLLGAPLGIAALVFTAISATRFRLARAVLVALSAVCLLGFVNSANRLFYAQSLVVEADRDLANRIVDRIHALGVVPESSPTAVEFVGAHQMRESPVFPRISSSTLVASFFEWEGGNPRRIAIFMRSMGYDLRPITARQRDVLLERIKMMPLWPAEGSVRYIDGVIVVKFTDYTELQRRLGLAG